MDNQYIDDATRRDLSRQDATATDTDFTLSLEEVAERYARAGHARTLRSLQRYCASGHLDAQKIATTTGDKYLVTPQSVARHIAQIKEFAAARSRRDISRRVATCRDTRSVAPETPATPQPMCLTTGPSVYARPVATGRDRERASCHGNACSAAKSATGSGDRTRHAATGRDRTGRDRGDVALCRAARTTARSCPH